MVGALVLWLAAGGLGYVEIRIAQVVLACTGIVGFTIACFLAWMSPLEPDLSELRMDTSCTNKKMRKKRFLRWPAPKEIAARLACLDESPNLWHWLVDDLGTESARLYISSLEESAALANTWYPKLKQLEEQCRAENPLPSIGDFTPAERAQYDLYCQKIGEDERPRRNAYDALFFSLPPVGLVAAADLWPGREERTVFLTPSEWQKWHGIYEHPDEAFWWFTNYHWEIKTSPSPEDFSFSPEGQADVLANHILPENAVWWVFQHGMAWGSLAGSYQAELWAWDGTHATFVDDLWLAVS
ncbi:MAG: hypothetical protein JW818_02915 [Pirellulales bacterium]|nr:hypothetical protein [Pirellulales bacterium]